METSPGFFQPLSDQTHPNPWNRIPGLSRQSRALDPAAASGIPQGPAGPAPNSRQIPTLVRMERTEPPAVKFKNKKKKNREKKKNQIRAFPADPAPLRKGNNLQHPKKLKKNKIIIKKSMDGRGCQGAARNPQENVGLPWRLAGRARGTERIRGMEANPSGKARGAAEGMERSWDFMEFRGFSSRMWILCCPPSLIPGKFHFSGVKSSQ